MRIGRITAVPVGILAAWIALAGIVAPSAAAQTGVYELQSEEDSGYCLNGYIGTAHAEVTLQTCNVNDDHDWWSVTENGVWTLQGDGGGYFYCLNGYIGTAHAEVTLTPPGSNDVCPVDEHVDWDPEFIGTSNGDQIVSFENEANGYCLNGTLSLVYMSTPPCDGDHHVEWLMVPF
jgi:hypothetical protein